MDGVVERLEGVGADVWVVMGAGEGKSIAVVREAAANASHSLTHALPLANSYDTVKEVFLPREASLGVGYAVMLDGGLAKVGLGSLRLLSRIDVRAHHNCTPGSLGFLPKGTASYSTPSHRYSANHDPRWPSRRQLSVGEFGRLERAPASRGHRFGCHPPLFRLHCRCTFTSEMKGRTLTVPGHRAAGADAGWAQPCLCPGGGRPHFRPGSQVGSR